MQGFYPNMKEKIFIIDDNEKLCESLEMNLMHLGYKCDFRTNSQSSLDFLENENPDLILLDLSLGDENGLDILKNIKIRKPIIPVIMITGFGTITTAVEAIKAGAVDYIQKPLNFSHLLKIIENTIKLEPGKVSESFITQSPEMKKLLNKAEKLAQTDFPVLITGESGTGKERLAHFIHENSNRKNKKLQIINSAAFPESLLDNELFGHEKGAYTGADTDFKGIFERSDSSTLFMDEIGDMTLQTQVKILRTLQNNEIRRIGGNDIRKIDVRFIGATNRDLLELMQIKRFREDLYYRLSTAILHVPSLRKRKEDILPLADYFLRSCFQDRKFSLTDEAKEGLHNYQWPGNIRELKNSIQYAGALASDDRIHISDFPISLSAVTQEKKVSVISLEGHEKNAIMKALNSTNNNKTEAAELLNISRKTLYNKIAKYGIKSE